MPMLVAEKDLTDNKYPVIDGQHRLEAIKTLNLPVDFIVSNKTNANNILIIVGFILKKLHYQNILLNPQILR